MSTNSELADLLRGIADLLDLQGERFKPEAYRRAARSIESLAEDIRVTASRGQLGEIPGVGEAIEEKIREFLKTGSIAYHERLRHEVPAGLVEIMQLPGLGPKTARRFYVELQIEGPQELAEAIRQGRLNGLKGFGPRKIELIRQALEGAKPTGLRTPLLEAFTIAHGIVRLLQAEPAASRVEVAGSLRRRRESVGDLDILVTSTEAERVFDVFTALPGIARVLMRGPTKETVVWTTGIQIDVRVVEPGEFGAALLYFTGSKDHNIHLRSLARDRGLKINEYGIFRGEERLGGTTEEEVYAALGLTWIPAEIREDRGEIDAAAKGSLPRLVELTDLRGTLHEHLAEVTEAAVDALLASAPRREYLGIVLREDQGDQLDDLQAILAHRAAGSPAAGPAMLVGMEGPWGSAALSRPLPSGVDYRVAVPPEGKPPIARDGKRARGPLPWFLGHLPLSGPEGHESHGEAGEWIDWARKNQVALEVTPRAPQDGLDSSAVRAAGDSGIDLVLSPGSGTSDVEERLTLAVGLARRGWAGRERILNARELPRLGSRRS